MNQQNSELIPFLQALIQDPALNQLELVQSLWSDFGQLLRCYSPARKSPLIVKLIKSPAHFHHPRGWNSEHSQQRKWRSYQIEQCFYEQYATNCDAKAPLANLIAVGNYTDSIALVLSDLNEAGYPNRHNALSIEACFPVLEWLASFHASFYQSTTKGLWPQGSYWHLATRQDEFAKMAASPLKTFAKQFDEALQQCPYRCLIHGDAKVANFCFSPDGSGVAAVDFQYVGGGVGVQDVAYFLGSALSDEDLICHTECCLDYYFVELHSALSKRVSAQESKQVCDHWRALYCVANADFHRFLAGWSPTHFKINQQLRQQTEQAISYITQTAPK